MNITLPSKDKWINPVYHEHVSDDTPNQIYFGGSSSGKSVFLAQRAVIDLLEGGRNYLILRKVQRDCRKSVWNEVKKVLSKLKGGDNRSLLSYVKENKTEMSLTFPNGYQILFGGLDDRERVKSLVPEKGVITDIWLEEATEFDREDYKQLTKRLRGESKNSKRITMSFNPIIKQHWIYEKFFSGWDESNSKFKQDGLLILKTTYRDNDFLTQGDVDRLLAESDSYYRDVYVEGNWGVLGDVIFTNWEVRDLSDMRDKVAKSCHGLDFGFSSDPAAVVEQYFDRSSNTLYIFDEIYETGLTDTQLGKKTKDMVGKDLVICDSAEPKSIKHLKDEGVNAKGVKKGKGSVETRYRWYQGINIVVNVKCVNTKRELQLHQWRKDKYGNSLPKPEDKNAHALDGSMYGCEEYWSGKDGVTFWNE